MRKREKERDRDRDREIDGERKRKKERKKERGTIDIICDSCIAQDCCLTCVATGAHKDSARTLSACEKEGHQPGENL